MIEKVIKEAYSWLGTRFKHQGRVKINHNNKGGCDCLGLIMGLGLKTKLGKDLKEFDQKSYPKILKSNALLDEFDSHFVKNQSIAVGNILLIKVNNWPQHLAIVVEVEPEVLIIHSYIQARKVVKQHLPKEWKENIAAIYKLGY